MPPSLRARREPPASGPSTTVLGTDSAKRPLFGRLFGLFGARPAGQKAADPNDNALFAFPSEATLRAPIAEVTTRPKARPRSSAPLPKRLVRPMLIAAALIVVSSLIVLAIRFLPISGFTTPAPRDGNLTIDSRPVPSEVLIDGQRRGTTPLKLSLSPGAHTVIVRTANDERVVPLTIAAGADVTQYFEMKAPQPAARLGQVSIETDPPGARVTIDGQRRGTSPLTVSDLTAEEHTITVTSATGSAERTVTVTPGGTASVMFSLTKVSGPVGGWLSISSPFEVDVVENDDVIGTSASSQIMLAAGRHSVTLTNNSLGYVETRTIDVTAGKKSAIRVDPPKASISVNARPWAEVTVDGTSVGQTPIANLLVGVGPHEMVFKHPQLGERRETVVVTAKGPNRTAVDLTK